jgi:hypothetical protein
MVIALPLIEALIGGAVVTLLYTIIGGGDWNMRAFVAMWAFATFILLMAFTGPWVIGG